MTFRDFLPCLEAMAVAAILPISFLLLVSYFGRRKRDRLAKWRAIGLTPQKWTWEALRAYDALAGEHRGRSCTMSSHTPDESVLFGGPVTRIRVAVRSPLAVSLTITPKWPQRGLVRLFAPATRGIQDSYSIKSNPPELALQALAMPRISEILLSHPKPAIELKGNQLQLERQGYFPDPQDAVALFDTMCDLAQLIEQATSSPGAGLQLAAADPAGVRKW